MSADAQRDEVPKHSGEQGTKDEKPLEGGARMKSKGKDASKFIHPWYRLWLYDLFLWVWSIIFDCFFREIRPRGAFRLPRKDAIIFVAAPHANQFVDPILLMNQIKRESNRRASFLMAAVSYNHPFIGALAKIQMAIPVSRPQDNLKKGTGKIFVNFDENPLLVKGKGTMFTKECMVKGLVALPQSLGASIISEIISDTELLIRKEFRNTEKIKTLLKQGTSFKKADKVDQNQVYEKVFGHLSSGQCIGIFPEGGSHDRTDLLPIKAGVAVMALGAMDYDPNCNVKIVPCGMNYFNAHKFRSRAVIEFGKPIEVPAELVKQYSNPETNRESVKSLLDLITTGLKSVTVTCEDYETLMVVHAARRLYAGNLAQQLPLPLIVEMNRRLVLGYETFKDNSKVQEIKKKILKYNEKLRYLYLPDHHVESCDESNKLRVLPVFLFRIVKLLCLMLLALPGATLFSPVFLSAKLYSNRKKKLALANSVVKVKANDVVASWKILIGLGIAPLVYSFYATIGTWYCYKHDMLNFRLFWIWVTLYLCGVLVTYSALITGEQGVDIFKSLRPMYLSITSGSSIKELKNFRRQLAEEITDLVNTFGPELFPDDFNLLKMKEKLLFNDNVKYIDSDEEEDLKTQELRNRRIQKRKAAKDTAKNKSKIEVSTDDLSNDSSSGLSLTHKYSSSVSDGISRMNSENSLTDIPMFSDYQLHLNSKNSTLKLDQQSTLNSTVSMAEDYPSVHPHPPQLSRDNSSSQIEFNFGSSMSRSKLSGRIKDKIRESRDKEN